MRILFAIPHFFDSSAAGGHASESGSAEGRAAIIRLCLASLEQHFSPSQSLINSHWACFHPVNAHYTPSITIVLCTTGDSHLVSCLDGCRFEHVRTDAVPWHLGFECHKVLREHLAEYDYFAYLEDDLRIWDGLFFTKLAWFNALFGDAALLQPNRFELTLQPVPYKLYGDGNVSDLSLIAGLQRIDEQPRLEAEAFGSRIVFQRVENPHSGCFFLTAAQLAHWAAQPDFAVPSRAFCGPLESAATLGIMRHFRVYKPARENAAFLELEHLEARLLDKFYAPIPGEPGSLRALPAK
jgi:hypothetical protein